MKRRARAFCALTIATALAFSACVPRSTPEPVPVEPEENSLEPLQESDPLSGEDAESLSAMDEELLRLEPDGPGNSTVDPDVLEESGDFNEAANQAEQTAKNYMLPGSFVYISSASDEQIDLSIPEVFNITRPTKELTTTYSAYFITGTSNPARPVYFDGEEIERQGTKGVFGVHVELDMGKNTFTFRQGDETQTVTIIREEQTPYLMTEIRQSSMLPAHSAGAKAGESLTVSCVAPSGAVVTASFAGETVTLRQAASADPGIAATFTGKIPIGDDYEKDITQKVGPVTYKMSYKGETKTYTSSGDVYVAGKNSDIAVAVSIYAGFVYPDTSKPALFKEKMKKGARDYVTGQNNDYFYLASGGYLPTGMAEIIEGKVKITSTLSKVTPSMREKRETYVFSGAETPAYATWVDDEKFTITFYNVKGSPRVDVDGSKLFSKVTIDDEGTTVTYTFAIKNREKLWGYDVSFDGTDTLLKFKYKPELSGNSATPLEGITILLDPGHGGTDPGALGLAGTTGPDENMINLAHAYAARDLLRQMGATVYLTRDQDYHFTLDDRLEVIEEWDADIFLSIHHNSIGENADANKASGMEVYYHTPLSKELANTMLESLADGIDRKDRFVEQSYYRVTLMPYAPALLLELGFMSNPAEYESLTDRQQISKVVTAIADGLVKALQ